MKRRKTLGLFTALAIATTACATDSSAPEALAFEPETTTTTEAPDLYSHLCGPNFVGRGLVSTNGLQVAVAASDGSRLSVQSEVAVDADAVACFETSDDGATVTCGFYETENGAVPLEGSMTGVPYEARLVDLDGVALSEADGTFFNPCALETTYTEGLSPLVGESLSESIRQDTRIEVEDTEYLVSNLVSWSEFTECIDTAFLADFESFFAANGVNSSWLGTEAISVSVEEDDLAAVTAASQQAAGASTAVANEFVDEQLLDLAVLGVAWDLVATNEDGRYITPEANPLFREINLSVLITEERFFAEQVQTVEQLRRANARNCQ